MLYFDFLIELHLDDVLKVLLVVGFKFIFYKIEIDKYYFWKIHSKITMISISISMFLFELLLDVVLEVLLMVVRFEFASELLDIAHFIKPYRELVHLLTRSRQGFMKLAVYTKGRFTEKIRMVDL